MTKTNKPKVYRCPECGQFSYRPYDDFMSCDKCDHEEDLEVFLERRYPDYEPKIYDSLGERIIF